MDAPVPVLQPVLPRRPRRRGRVVVALILLVLGVGAFLAYQLSRANSTAPAVERLVVVAPDGSLVTMDRAGRARSSVELPGVTFQFPAWSPDGMRFAAIGSSAETGGVYVIPATSTDGEPELIYSSENNRPFYLSWSPDGSQVTFLTNQPDGIGLRVAPADGRTPATLVRSGSPMYWDWIDPARLLVHTGSSGPDAFVGEVDLAGETLADPGMDPGYFRAPGFGGANGRRAWTGPGADDSQVIVIEGSGGGARHEVPVMGSVAITFNPAGDTLAFIATDRPVADSVPLPVGPLRAINSATGSVRILVEAPVVAFFWSPDGRTIATIEVIDDTPDNEVLLDDRLAAAEGFEPVAAADDGVPVQLRFVDVATGESRADREIHLTDLFAFQVLPFFDQYALSHRLWAPDSSAIVLPVSDDGIDRLVLLPGDGGEPERLADGVIGFWSP